jgi:hypothetical protein
VGNKLVHFVCTVVFKWELARGRLIVSLVLRMNLRVCVLVIFLWCSTIANSRVILMQHYGKTDEIKVYSNLASSF